MSEFSDELVALLPRLRRLGRALARDHADADDLVQMTVERALAHQASWRHATRLDHWMFRIMKNAWIDETRVRSRKAAVIVPEAEGNWVGADGARDMETRLAAAEAASAVAALPEDQRLAVALVLVEGLSYREAAQVLEIPEGTLTSRLVRGRTALLARLEASK